jgi:hypothetical protein
VYFVPTLGSKYPSILLSFGEKMPKNSKIISIVTLVFLLCSMLASVASAAEDNATRDPATDITQDSETPMLIATQDDSVIGENGTLYQTRDNSTAVTDTPAISDSESGDVLIATQSNPDYSGYIIAAVALAVVVSVSSFIAIKKRK